jgi:hypothetical protein
MQITIPPLCGMVFKPEAVVNSEQKEVIIEKKVKRRPS